MTTKQIFHLRIVEANESPVSLGLFTDQRHALATLQTHVGDEESLVTWMQANPGESPDDNLFNQVLACLLDECGTNTDQADCGDVVDFVHTSDGDGYVTAVYWIEAVALHDQPLSNPLDNVARPVL